MLILITKQLFLYSLCAKVPDDETAEKMALKILADFEMKPYDSHLITEEEFIYDCLNNDQVLSKNLYKLFRIASPL